jgi:hypothetical protein
MTVHDKLGRMYREVERYNPVFAWRSSRRLEKPQSKQLTTG